MIDSRDMSIALCFEPPEGADINLDNYEIGECPCILTKKE